MKIVKLEWIDPQFLEMRGLSYEDDIEGLQLQKCVIVGHLVKETKDIYFIAKGNTNAKLYNDGNGSYEWNEILCEELGLE